MNNDFTVVYGTVCTVVWQEANTKVYITSNIPLEEQYRDIQRYQLETWRAFLRRIHNVIEYLPDDSTVQHKKGGFPCDAK